MKKVENFFVENKDSIRVSLAAFVNQSFPDEFVGRASSSSHSASASAGGANTSESASNDKGKKSSMKTMTNLAGKECSAPSYSHPHDFISYHPSSHTGISSITFIIIITFFLHSLSTSPSYIIINYHIIILNTTVVTNRNLRIFSP